VPLLVVTGQAPVAKLHKEDFQAVDIAAIAAPVTKHSETVMEPAQLPGAFQRAFHIMRSGRPGPVLLDLPIDVQVAEIEFDIDTCGPLPVSRPAATREQAERAIDMLSASERPLIVAGGGIVNADAAALLVQLAETLDVPVVPTLMGWGTIPDDHRLMAGMAGLQTAHRYGNATLLASDFVMGIGNRWANRHTGGLDVYRAGRMFVHVDIEPTQIGRIFTPTTPSCPTRRPRWSAWSRWPGSVAPPARCPTARRGWTTAPSGRRPCTAVPTSRTCRSSHSASTRR
jgi:tartronate-semialdehyde synthase